MEKICPKCGHTFTCNRQDMANCQCIKVSLNPHQIRYIHDTFHGCLCQSCLQKISKADFHPVSKLASIARMGV